MQVLSAKTVSAYFSTLNCMCPSQMFQKPSAEKELELTSDLKEDFRIVTSKEVGASALEAPGDDILKFCWWYSNCTRDRNYLQRSRAQD